MADPITNQTSAQTELYPWASDDLAQSFPDDYGQYPTSDTSEELDIYIPPQSPVTPTPPAKEKPLEVTTVKATQPAAYAGLSAPVNDSVVQVTPQNVAATDLNGNEYTIGEKAGVVVGGVVFVGGLFFGYSEVALAGLAIGGLTGCAGETPADDVVDTAPECEPLVDNDSDGYFAPNSECAQKRIGGAREQPLDCNDNAPQINPEADEIPGNNVDENCDGTYGTLPTDTDETDSPVETDDTDGTGETDETDSAADTDVGDTDDTGEIGDTDETDSPSDTAVDDTGDTDDSGDTDTVVDTDDSDSPADTDFSDVTDTAGDTDILETDVTGETDTPTDTDETVDTDVIIPPLDYDVDRDGHLSLEGGGDDENDNDPSGYRYVSLRNDIDDDRFAAGLAVTQLIGDDAPALTIESDESLGEDCDDTRFAVNPAATEVPYDGLDNDCADGDLLDVDEDGHLPEAFGGDDHDDADPLAYYGAIEIPYDGIDQDGDGEDLVDVDQDGVAAAIAGGTDPDDENRDVWRTMLLHPDTDQDGYAGDPAQLLDVGDVPMGYSEVSAGDDCDDTRAAVNPGETEVVYNGLNDDCNVDTPDDDLDVDGYGVIDDCNESNPAINPGAAEIYDAPLTTDGIDENCDGEAETICAVATGISFDETPGLTVVGLEGADTRPGHEYQGDEVGLPDTVAVCDVDGDGIDDLITSGHPATAPYGRVNITFGRSDLLDGGMLTIDDGDFKLQGYQMFTVHKVLCRKDDPTTPAHEDANHDGRDDIFVQTAAGGWGSTLIMWGKDRNNWMSDNYMDMNLLAGGMGLLADDTRLRSGLANHNMGLYRGTSATGDAPFNVLPGLLDRQDASIQLSGNNWYTYNINQPFVGIQDAQVADRIYQITGGYPDGRCDSIIHGDVDADGYLDMYCGSISDDYNGASGNAWLVFGGAHLRDPSIGGVINLPTYGAASLLNLVTFSGENTSDFAGQRAIMIDADNDGLVDLIPTVDGQDLDHAQDASDERGAIKFVSGYAAATAPNNTDIRLAHEGDIDSLGMCGMDDRDASDDIGATLMSSTPDARFSTVIAPVTTSCSDVKAVVAGNWDGSDIRVIKAARLASIVETDMIDLQDQSLQYPVGEFWGREVESGDLNGDGAIDLVICSNAVNDSRGACEIKQGSFTTNP